MMRLQTSLFTVLLAMGLARSAAAEKDRHEVGEPAPSFTLKAINGDDVGETYISIDRYFGPQAKDPKKAVILSFFATYCEPCKREMPLLAALHDTYKDQGLQVVLVTIDKEPDKIEEARQLAKQYGVKFPVLSDRFNIVAKRYFVAKLPNLYILNGEGKVAMVNVGYNEDISRKLVDEVRKAIGVPTSDPVPEAVAKHMGHGAAGVTASATTAAPQTAVAQAAEAPKAAEPAKAEVKANDEKEDNRKGKRKARRGKRRARK